MNMPVCEGPLAPGAASTSAAKLNVHRHDIYAYIYIYMQVYVRVYYNLVMLYYITVYFE